MSTLPKQPDDELRDWMADWQADPGPTPEVREAIRRRVKRQGLKLALCTAAEVTVSLLMLAFVLRAAVKLPVFFNVATMAGLALVIVWALIYGLWSLRSTWRPNAETTSAFLDLSILRCRRRLRTLRAAWWLLGLELAILIPWLWLLLSSRPSVQLATRSHAAAYGALAFMTALAVLFLIGMKRRVRRELRELEELRESLGGEG